MKYLLSILTLIAFFGRPAHATHIVGGVLSYECLNYNTTTNQLTIRLTLRVYRDAINGQAPFDNPAYIGVYINGSTSTTAFQTLSLGSPNITTMTNNDLGPCAPTSPTPISTQEGIYTITTTVPYNANGYWFSYQRCCRNNTISNLINPGAVGATYTIFMSGLAQQICNDSPVFDNYPPIFLCTYEPLVFDHAATDQNGHRLEYSLCSPFTGATAAAPMPIPSAGPPYTMVPFSGGFSAGFPMSASPALSIHPTTGQLTGTPTVAGQYVVGVCVQEYDANNNLISTTLRDFQFNVLNCISTIDARIYSNFVDPGGDHFLVNQCDNNTITFINQSTAIPMTLITGYEWRFDLNNGNFFTSNQFSPTVTFPGPGTYSGWLIVNPGQTNCTDTAYISVNVYPPIYPLTSVTIDSCNIAVPPLLFTDSTTFGGPGEVVAWLWDFGDGTTSTQQHPQHLFPNAGTYTVSLSVTDSNGCTDNYTMPVDWYPPAIPQFTVDDPDGCAPHTANFIQTSHPFIASYQTIWYFGDGDSATTSPNASHIYPNPGTYSVTLRHVSPWGCESSLTVPNMITVYELPTAGYTYQYDSCVYEAVDFFDTSLTNSSGTPIVSWLWDFKDSTFATTQHASHLYVFAGSYPVDLTITDANGCTSTIADSIHWYPKPVIDVTITSPFGCAPYTCFFDNQSYPINGYSTIWDFGDGNSDTIASPTHIYQNPGLYYVSLVITSPLGCTDTFLDTIQVRERPNADFNFSFDPCVYGPVSFDEFSTTNSNGDPLVNYTWHFDDGTTLQAQDTSHLYALAGDYNVSLVVEDIHGCTDTATQLVRWHPAPIFDVDVSDSVGCQPLTVTFTNNSYPINGYSTTWTFGDGTTDTVASPTHTFIQHGIHIVQLHVVSPTNCVGDFYDTIVVHQIPSANFNYHFDSCSFEGVHIGDLSVTNQAGTPLVSWEWDFDIGTATLGYSLTDTLVSYTPRADYNVSLVVTDMNGCTDTLNQLIPYHPAPVFPVGSHNQEACIPVSIDFDNNILNQFPGYSFLWNFGNGQTSTVFDTSYVYPTEGIFYPTLTVVTAKGCIGIFQDTIVANGIPQAVFDANYDPCAFNQPTRFRNLSIPSQQGILNQTQWDFGDGTGGTNPLEYHHYNYPDTGYYSISLYVEDDNGCSDDTTGQFYWRPQPVIPMSLDDSKGCVPHLAPAPDPNPYPGDGYTTTWSFGDGRTSTLAAPEIIYTVPGVYTRAVTITSPIGCTETFSSTHTALEVPIAGFVYSPPASELHIFNSEVSFSDSSQRANLWWWDFGDGETILLRHPKHTYRDTGLFVVTQVVTHINGCTDTAQQVLDIVPKFSYWLPNAFTPNGDGKNDIYMGKGYFQYITNFEMAIYNRWGERIYLNNSPYESWNGRKNNTGELCQAGVYVVVVRFHGPRGERQEIKGFATIVY